MRWIVISKYAKGTWGIFLAMITLIRISFQPKSLLRMRWSVL